MLRASQEGTKLGREGRGTGLLAGAQPQGPQGACGTHLGLPGAWDRAGHTGVRAGSVFLALNPWSGWCLSPSQVASEEVTVISPRFGGVGGSLLWEFVTRFPLMHQ